MSEHAFDEFADVYEAMIDWDKRLAHETPFYRWLLECVGAARVLDAACGTGRHAALFYDWGLAVEGSDLSSAMIEQCRRRWPQDGRRSWVVRPFDQPPQPPQPPGQFDLAICVGNSLALAGDLTVVERAVAALLSAVRPGGAVMLHVVNLWRLPEGLCQWQKCVRKELPTGPALIIKGIHRCGERGFVDLLVTEGEPPRLRSRCAPFLGLKADKLESLARRHSAAKIELFGGYGREPYNPGSSQDLIVVAFKD